MNTKPLNPETRVVVMVLKVNVPVDVTASQARKEIKSFIEEGAYQGNYTEEYMSNIPDEGGDITFNKISPFIFPKKKF